MERNSGRSISRNAVGVLITINSNRRKIAVPRIVVWEKNLAATTLLAGEIEKATIEAVGFEQRKEAEEK